MSESHHHAPFYLVHGQAQRGSTGSVEGRTLALGYHRGLERTRQSRVMLFWKLPKRAR